MLSFSRLSAHWPSGCHQVKIIKSSYLTLVNTRTTFSPYDIFISGYSLKALQWEVVLTSYPGVFILAIPYTSHSPFLLTPIASYIILCSGIYPGVLTPGDLGGLPSHIPTLPALLGERNYSSLLLGKTKIDLKLMAMYVFGKIYGKLFPGKWHLGVGAEG